MISDDWAKTQAEAEIAQVKNAIEDASVETVETPSGRKDVEVAYDDGREFIVEEGAAIGVYFQPSRARPSRVHIDWEDDQRGRTTVKWHNVVDFEESEYYRK